MLPILLCSLAAVVGAAPGRADMHGVPMPGAIEAPLFWDVQAFPDGPTLTLNGTIQEMRRQLLEINPSYDTDFNHHAAAAAAAVEKRTDFSGAKVLCGSEKWGVLTVRGYSEGIDYLRNHGGVPHMPAGPSACSRVSCSYNTGIWWCNDAREEKALLSFGSISDGAVYIWTQCGNNSWKQVGGQVFHYTDWNVILRQQDC
ncbi:Uncharacterized protein TPAR_01987 [Tolypocladium paradoxum]|uniref:Secreted protein n=1 Tax=Tolypocladium paradoxum TaxID=94208 RepID=A0A2S4L5S2_9HYPO|nr:Uncharacterized protein TPAR_01987 [Tolypocladium paradoxum]